VAAHGFTLLLVATAAHAQVRETWRNIFDFGTPYSDDLARSIAVHPAGGYVIAGSTLDQPMQYDRTNPLCVRLDANGNVLWSQSFTGDAHNDSVRALAVAPSGNIYCAISPTALNQADVRVVKYDASGNQVWVAGPYGGPQDEVVNALLIDAAENTFVGCTRSSAPAATADMLVLSFDSAGNQRFATAIDGPASAGDILNGMCFDPSGNLIAVGSMDGVQAGASKLAVVKLDPNGNVRWIRTHVEGPPLNTQFLSAATCDAAGNVYAVGGFVNSPLPNTGVLLSYDPSGQLRWSDQLPPGSGNTIGNSVAMDPWGYVVVASTWGSGSLVIKYATNGNEAWDRTLDGLSPLSFAMGPNGDMTLGGIRPVTPQTADMVITRLGANGSVRWTQDIDVSGGNEILGGLVLAPNGHVGVTGWTASYALGVGYGPSDALTVDLFPQSTSFCYGDGVATACPCGNSSSPFEQAGCSNSTGFAGRLFDSGDASISADTLLLTATSVPGSALFFQGTSRTAGGAGAPFGDGLRCVGGSVVRLHTVTPSGVNVASYPSGVGALPIHVLGSTAAGDVRHYQCWYRNAAAFCTPSTFNLTQGLTITWGP
jgi:hypothetical protein